MEQKPSKAAGGWRLSTRAAEVAVALFTLVLGVVITHASWELGARWASDGPQAGYFPFYIGLLICAGSVVNLLAGALSPRIAARPPFFDWEALQRISSVLFPAAIYVAGIHLVGIYVSSLAYIAFFMVWIGGYGIHKALAVGFGVSAVMFLMFEVWFQVLLPKGAYNVLGYFGY